MTQNPLITSLIYLGLSSLKLHFRYMDPLIALSLIAGYLGLIIHYRS